MGPITESEAEIVQNESDMPVSQYSNKMAVFEKIDTFSLGKSHIVSTPGVHMRVLSTVDPRLSGPRLSGPGDCVKKKTASYVKCHVHYV